MTIHRLRYTSIKVSKTQVSYSNGCFLGGFDDHLLGCVDHRFVAKVVQMTRGHQSIATIIACVGMHVAWNDVYRCCRHELDTEKRL